MGGEIPNPRTSGSRRVRLQAESPAPRPETSETETMVTAATEQHRLLMRYMWMSIGAAVSTIA
ncbi:MAG TPA: hypothetical protein VLS92_05375, partial [Acidimicrobiia bacterium]|nr:hypothetical protein [Acidimicrobiia bacterium]